MLFRSQTFGNPVVSQTNPNVGVYAQDEWRASSRLTVNAGLRYDLQFLETIHTDRNNVSPRLGFAWTPGDSQGLVVRGGVGVFFDRVPLRATANALFAAAALLLAYGVLHFAMRLPFFPLREIRITEAPLHVTPEQIEAIVVREIKGNIFTLEIGRAHV